MKGVEFSGEQQHAQGADRRGTERHLEYVVSGRPEIIVDYERRILDLGDAYYFESCRPHRSRCAGASRAR